MIYCENLLYSDEEARGSTILLPVGSFEDHGDGPMILDTMLALDVACRASRHCKALVAWPLGYSFSACHKHSVSLDEDLDALLAGKVIEGLLGLGARRVLVIDGHYGHRVALERVAVSRGALYVNVWDLLAEEGYDSFDKQLEFEKLYSSSIRSGASLDILERVALRITGFCREGLASSAHFSGVSG